VVMTISIRGYGIERLDRGFASLRVKLPKALDRDSRRIMNRYKKGLRRTLKFSGMGGKPLIDTGELYNSIQYRKIGQGEYALFMARYGEWIDSMRAHRVKIAGKPRLEAWVSRKLPDYTGNYLFVRRHPWISAGLATGRNQIRKEITRGETVRMIRKFVAGGF